MISVLLPTYNQARFLPYCLASLLLQAYADFEVIICDDGSTDGTADCLKWVRAGPELLKLRVVTHPANLGTAAAINSAAKLMSDGAKLVTWVSSDNVMHPQWLNKLARMLDGDGVMMAVYSPYNRIDCFPDQGKTRPRTVTPGPYDPARLIDGVDCYFGPSFLVRREAWLEHRDGLAHDYDWWLRFEERTHAIGYCPEPLCDYRMGPWQTGRNKPAALLDDARRRQAEARERRRG